MNVNIAEMKSMLNNVALCIYIYIYIYKTSENVINNVQKLMATSRKWPMVLGTPLVLCISYRHKCMACMCTNMLSEMVQNLLQVYFILLSSMFS